MATEVENRVVQMTFNNKSFEKGVETTLKTIDKLNNALKFKGASKGFQDVEEASEEVDFKVLSDKLDKLTDKFSGLGIIGMKIWGNIGDAIWNFVTSPLKNAVSAVTGGIDKIENQIKTGGWNRALNLEKAQKMLKNLHYGWESNADAMTTINDEGKEVANTYYYVNKAVTDTQYSLDEAASSAANFLASGVENGQELYDTLRSVMGVSSTFSTDFGQVANYFQSMASLGYLGGADATYMTRVVGVPIKQMLQEYLGMTADQINEAIEKKAISFDVVRDMFLQEFGDSLDKANETYTGALSNFNAALSRVGAKVAEPLLQTLIPLLNTARILVNDINNTLTESGALDFIVDVINKVGEFSKTLIEADENGKMHVVGPLKELTHVVGNLLKIFGIIGKAVVEAFSIMFTEFSDGESAFGKFANTTDGWLEAVTKAYEEGYITSFFIAIFKAIKALVKVIKIAITIVAKALGVVIKIGLAVGYVIEKIFEFIGSISDMVAESEIFQAVVEGIWWAFDKVKEAIKTVIDFIADVIEAIVNFIDENELIQKALDGVKTGYETLCTALSAAWDLVAAAFSTVIEFAGNVLTQIDWDEIGRTILGTFDEIPGVIEEMGTKISEFLGLDVVIPKAWEGLKQFWEDLSGFITDAYNGVKNFFLDLWDNPLDVVDNARDSAAEAVSEGMVKAEEKMEKFSQNAKAFAEGWGDSAKALNDFNDATKALDESDQKLDFFDGLAVALGALSTAFSVFTGALRDLGGAIISVIADAWSKFREMLGDDVSLEHALEIFHKLVQIWATSEWGKAGKNFADLTGSIADGIAKLTGTVGSRGLKSIGILMKNIGKAMLLIGIAILFVAAAVRYVMDSPNFDNFEEVMDKFAEFLGIMFGGIAIVAKLIQKHQEKHPPKTLADKIKTMGDGLKTIADSASKIDFMAIAAVIAAAAWGVAKLVKAMAILIAVITLTDANPGSVVAACVIVIATLLILVLFLKLVVGIVSHVDAANYSGVVGSLKAIAAVFVALAVVLSVVVGAIVVITLLQVAADKLGQPNAISKAFGMVVGIMAILMVFVMVMAGVVEAIAMIGNKRMDANALGETFLGMALVLAAMAAMMLVIIPLIAVMALMSEDKLTSVTDSFTAIIFILTVFMGVMAYIADALDTSELGQLPKLFLALAVVMVAMAASISIIAGAASGGDKPNTIGGAALSMALIFLVLGIIVAAIGALNVGGDAASTFAGMAAAMLACAAAVKILTTIDQDDLLHACYAMIAIIVIIAVLATAIHVVPGIESGLAALGGSFLAVGIGVFLIAAGLVLLTSLLDVSLAALDGFVVGFIQLCEDIKPLLSEFVEAIIVLIVGIIVGVLNGIAESIGDILFALGNILVNSAKGLGWIAYGLADALIQILIGVAMAFSDRSGEIGYAVGIFLEALLFAIGVALATFIAKIFERLKELLGIASPSKPMRELWDMVMEAIIVSIKSFFKKIGEAFGIVWTAIKTTVSGWVNKAKEIGSDIINWIVDGIKSVGNKIGDAVSGAVGGLQDGAVNIMESIFGDPQAEADEYIRKSEEAQKRIIEENRRVAAEKGNINWIARNGESYLRDYYSALYEAEKQANKLAVMNLNETLYSKKELADQRSVVNAAYRTLATQYSLLEQVVKDTGYMWDKPEYGKAANAFGHEIGQSIVEGYQQGLLSSDEFVQKSSGYKLMVKIYEDSKKALDSNSPSKKFIQLGEWSIQGYNMGLKEMANTSYKLLNDIFENLEEIPEDYSIRPVFDFSNIQNGTHDIADGLKDIKANSDIEIDTMNQTNAGRLSTLSDLVYDLIANSDNSGLTTRLDSQNEIIASIMEKLDGIGVYIDSGTMVGVLTPKIDTSLGKRVGQAGRSVHA